MSSEGYRVEVLDCTVRDGGYINDWDFPVAMVRDVYRRLSKAGVDLVEVGFRNVRDAGRREGPDWLRSPEDLLREVKRERHGARLSVLVDAGKATPADFLPRADSAIDMVRVAVHRNRVEEGIEFLAGIARLGYETSLQLMGYPQYSAAERREVLSRLRSVQVDYVYMADSYGTLLPDQVRELLEPLVGAGDFKVGFHPHNNLQLAFANSLEAIKAGVHVIDATLYGMGRGAGNLPTETLLALLQQRDPERYNLVPALECVDLYMVPLRRRFEWGYQLPFLLSGICECHPSYAKALVDTRRYTIGEVWRALKEVRRSQPVGFDRALLERIQDSAALEFGTGAEPQAEEDEAASAGPVIEGPPTYLDRHQGRVFLVLANGPSLTRYGEELRAFVHRHDPVILGANYLGGTLTPHYHAFVNAKRFVRYAHTVSPASRLLLSCFFSEEMIRQYSDREYERLLFRHGSRDELDLGHGVISNDCSSVSMLLIAVAMVMGASEVFVAGMDGYLRSGAGDRQYFYDEEDETGSAEFNRLRHRWGERTLALLDHHLVQSGRSGVNIITPTSYEKYFRGIQSLL